jgi:hypothetical protein
MTFAGTPFPLDRGKESSELSLKEERNAHVYHVSRTLGGNRRLRPSKKAKELDSGSRNLRACEVEST